MRYTTGHLVLMSHICFNFSNALRHPNARFAHSSLEQIILKEGRENSHSCPFSPIDLPTQNATRSFWLALPGDNPLAEEGSKGELTDNADVCIIGSGITGVSAAWHLSQMMNEYDFKTNVVVLEAREFCSGATGRNGGHLSPNTFSSFLDRQAKYNTSEAIKSYIIERYTADSLVKFLKYKKLEHNVDLVEGGHLTLLRTEDEERAAKADFLAASAAGLNLSAVKWIPNRKLKEEYRLNPNLNYTGVWWPGHNLWPCKLVTELFKDSQAGRNVSVVLHTKTPVTSITRPRSIPTRWALQTPRGSIVCNYVFHATNAYAGHLLPFFAGSREVGADSSMLTTGGFSPTDHESLHKARDFRIIPTRGQVAAVRASVAASQFLWRNGWHGSGGWEYWFPRFQGLRDMESGKPLIILGGGREFSGGNLEIGESDDGVVNARVTKALKAFLPEFFPALFKESEMESNWEMEWTGIMGFTNTHDPYVGPVLHPLMSTGTMQHNPFDGQYISAGYTGHGMVRAYACAETVAGMIKSRIIGEKWVLPEWLPERYLTSALGSTPLHP